MRNGLPDWAKTLRGAERFRPRSKRSASGMTDVGWAEGAGPLQTIQVSLPTNLRRWADDVDPLLPTLVVAETLRVLEDKLAEIVTVARERGHSWAEIAQALGVSKQAAWERYTRVRVDRAPK